LIIRSATKVTKEIIQSADSLKLIARAGVGVDNIDVVAATQKGIIVMNTPDTNTISAAEHTMALILAVSRNIPTAHLSLKNKLWNREKFVGYELRNKILGIVGLGRIGREVAKRAKAFEMSIISYDPYISKEYAVSMDIKLVGELKELLKEADYITLHIPLTKETKYLIDEEEINQMKSTAYIINVARGGIVNETALYNALKNGKIRGAALDVFEQEPAISSPLLELDNCLTVPHLGASTVEAQKSVSIEIAKQVADALVNNIIINAVNIPCIPRGVEEKIKPYIELSEKIGRLYAQIGEEHIEEINIEYSGETQDKNVEGLLTLSLLKGLLSEFMGKEGINYVNVGILTKERGIKVKESYCDASVDFVNLITLTVNKKVVVAGTLLSNKEQRIIKIMQFKIDLVPAGDILILSQTDEPGIIGKVGTILGKNNINIGEMQLSRTSKGGEALATWMVDCSVSQSVIREIEKIPQILHVKYIKL